MTEEETAKFRALGRYNVIMQQAWKRLDKCMESDRQGNYRQDGRYPFIAFSTTQFISQLSIANKIRTDVYKSTYRGSFLDVGCGIGTKLLIAAEIMDPFGVEINKKYIIVARRLVGKNKVTLADALTYDGYRNHDVLYFYRPMSDYPKQRDLETKIAKDAKPGAIILANMSTLNYADYALLGVHKVEEYDHGHSKILVKDTEEQASKCNLVARAYANTVSPETYINDGFYP